MAYGASTQLMLSDDFKVLHLDATRDFIIGKKQLKQIMFSFATGLFRKLLGIPFKMSHLLTRVLRNSL